MTSALIPVVDIGKRNLLDLDRLSLRAAVRDLGEPEFRADQLIKWVHQQGEVDFAKMTNLSKSLRDSLTQQFEIQLPDVIVDRTASDGTRKWLLKFSDSNCIEMVYIPDKSRGTLCVSSQVGCALNCSFCSTGKQGFSRDLSAGEIISQVWLAVRVLSETGDNRDHVLTNVVLMGMGEPLLNYDAVVKALNLMTDDFAYNLSKYRVTLSTSGVIPKMQQLKTEDCNVALAVSLHAPNDELRNKLVPLNKKYPLKMLMQTCKDYFEGQHKRSVTFEYVMLKNINDTIIHAKQLIKLLKDVPCKINLIPFNPFPLTDYECSSKEQIAVFQNILQNAGFNVIVRRTRGDDIAAACGQLVGEVQDRTGRHAKWLRDNIPVVVEETA